MDQNKQMADLLFPHIDKTPEYYEGKYPQRQLPEGAKVTRVAPSPTGFIHMGALYAAVIPERMAHQSGGVFFLRIEDTDKKREIEGGVSEIVKSFAHYELKFDEGMTGETTEKGIYGPYKQSERKEIYQTFAKMLIEKGLAYPCFCSEEDLNEIRAKQEELKQNPGYYGQYAKHRNATFDEIKSELDKGTGFVLRLKSPGKPENRIVIDDLIKGEVEMPENDQDIVLLKSDGIPTYHFAHAIDDHLMRTTHVIRGDEWLSSAPIHVQLFEILGWEKPRYAHVPPVLKMEGTSKRKLSKRKDPEAAVSYYSEQGFPVESVREYLLNLINSNYEEWRMENPTDQNTEFIVDLSKMGTSGALFDLVKLTDISKDRIALMSANKVYDLALQWAQQFDIELAEQMRNNEAYTRAILGIERGGDKPRKDIAKWSDVKGYLGYFYDNWFEEYTKEGYEFPENLPNSDVLEVLEAYKNTYNKADDKDTWFERAKTAAEGLGFARDAKTYKKDKESFKGHIGDFMSVIRVAISGRKNTPDLYELLDIMGEERLQARFEKAIKSI
ncbi:MAG: glutamate--tRNA ligase [Clostridiales bacterium GWB2_37_7]|nr:MAG: glutamate--tRNA ligase [Clostridiales bacterium GWB2_37_7]